MLFVPHFLKSQFNKLRLKLFRKVVENPPIVYELHKFDFNKYEQNKPIY